MSQVAVGSEMWMSLVKSYPWMAMGGMSFCLCVIAGWLVVKARAKQTDWGKGS